jgi:hypothetical protein
MRVKIVPSSVLSSSDLRASKYVVNPKRASQELVRKWSAEFGGVASMSSPAGKRLAELVEIEIRKAINK